MIVLNIKKVPNILTIMRIIIVPLIFILMYFNYSVTNILAIIFAFLACITDFFDGKIARKYNCCSSFGKCMDPIADKILVMTLIIMLIYQQKVWIFPSIIILSREFIISGVREFCAKEQQIIINVSYLAKIKTSLQMFSLLFLMIFDSISIMNIIGNILFTISAILSIITCLQYLFFVKKIIFNFK